MATLTKVLFCSQAELRGKMTLEQKGVFIYLLCETKEMKDAVEMARYKFLQAAESWREK